LRYLTISVASVWMLFGLSAVAGPNDEAYDPDLAIVSKYVSATHAQQEALRGAQMEVDIDATIPKLHKRATFRALRSISRLGLITYRALGFSGDNTVKKEVITRYLAAEAEGRENGSIAISPENYKFKYKDDFELNDRPVAILQITPRKKMVGLFKGELWIDVETGMPVRESGQFVKSPSVFLKKIVFVRDYELQDGVAIPKRIASTVETRVIGKAELLISFTNFTKPALVDETTRAADTAAETDPSAQDPQPVTAPQLAVQNQ